MCRQRVSENRDEILTRLRHTRRCVIHACSGATLRARVLCVAPGPFCDLGDCGGEADSLLLRPPNHLSRNAEPRFDHDDGAGTGVGGSSSSAVVVTGARGAEMGFAASTTPARLGDSRAVPLAMASTAFLATSRKVSIVDKAIGPRKSGAVMSANAACPLAVPPSSVEGGAACVP